KAGDLREVEEVGDRLARRGHRIAPAHGARILSRALRLALVPAVLLPLPADAGGGDRFVAGAEEEGLEEGLGGRSGEGGGVEVDGDHVGPEAGLDGSRGEAERRGAPR